MRWFILIIITIMMVIRTSIIPISEGWIYINVIEKKTLSKCKVFKQYDGGGWINLTARKGRRKNVMILGDKKKEGAKWKDNLWEHMMWRSGDKLFFLLFISLMAQCQTISYLSPLILMLTWSIFQYLCQSFSNLTWKFWSLNIRLS